MTVTAEYIHIYIKSSSMEKKADSIQHEAADSQLN